MSTIRVIWEAGADREIPLPAYETAGAAGADLRANLPEEHRALGIVLAPMERRIVPTGLRVEIPEGFEMQIRPRSGLAINHGVTVLNTPGTIDADYRGEIKVILINHGKEPFTIKRGMRIAQMVVERHVHVMWNTVDSLESTDRGGGGFGSTGS